MKKLIAAAVFCVFLFLAAGLAAGLSDAAQRRGENSIEVIYDQKATSQEYKSIWRLFKNELTQVLERNPGQIFGRHRILVLELVNSKNPDDMRFFIVLDKVKDPVVVHWQRVSRLINDKILHAFAIEAAQKTFLTLCEESEKSHGGGVILKIDPFGRIDL